MPGSFSSSALLLSLACCTLAAHAVQPAPPLVVRTEAQVKAVLATGQRTPLDLFTPHGKRRFLQRIVWRETGIGGFGGTQLRRELDAAQIGQVLAFLDLGAYKKVFSADLIGRPLRLPAPSARLEQQLEAFERLDAALRERRAQAADVTTSTGLKEVAQHYDKIFGARMSAAALRQQPLGDLPFLFDAAALASNTDPASAATGHLVLVHQELARRGIDTRRQPDDAVLDALMSARRFDQARTFASTLPHLKPQAIPAVVDPLGAAFRGRSVYDYDAAGNTLTRRAAPPAASELVMVVGAGCHFSRDALAALGKDAALMARLRQANLSLVIPPSSPIPLSYIAEWNAANPSLLLRVPYDTREWPALAEASTPEFFLLKDGKVAGHVMGWPEGGNGAALLALLDGSQAQVARP